MIQVGDRRQVAGSPGELPETVLAFQLGADNISSSPGLRRIALEKTRDVYNHPRNVSQTVALWSKNRSIPVDITQTFQ